MRVGENNALARQNPANLLDYRPRAPVKYRRPNSCVLAQACVTKYANAYFMQIRILNALKIASRFASAKKQEHAAVSLKVLSNTLVRSRLCSNEW